MKKITAVFAIFSLIGCGTIKQVEQKQIESSKEYAKPYDAVWAAILKTITDKGMPIKNTDKASGLITFERASDQAFYAEHFDCAKHPILAPEHHPISMTILLSKQNNLTNVSVKLFGSVTFTVQNVQQTFRCASKGTFEQEILGAI